MINCNVIISILQYHVPYMKDLLFFGGGLIVSKKQGPEGVKWELELVGFWPGKMGFWPLGLGFLTLGMGKKC